jgi:anthranilate synthase component 1
MDAVDAMLPAGTLSGAPKIRAMEILHELEKSPRGAYGGAVGYLDFSGNMDVCIGIRMAAASGGHVYVRSGGGVVADSVPSHEYEETVHKAQSMTEAIIKAQEAEGYDFTDR